MYRIFLKRPIDFILALIALILLSPVFIFVSILVKFKLGSPILFKQKRPGLNEEIFVLYKFRTMTDQKNEDGNLLPDSERLTRFGRMLRASSIDELPELVNILKGDMSLIGPRPLAVEYLPYYTESERRRHCVRPGLSGLAQINGRNTASWEERFDYDIKYVDNITFLGDLMILVKTIQKTIQRSDIGERGIDVPVDFHIDRRAILKGEKNEY